MSETDSFFYIDISRIVFLQSGFLCWAIYNAYSIFTVRVSYSLNLRMLIRTRSLIKNWGSVWEPLTHMRTHNRRHLWSNRIMLTLRAMLPLVAIGTRKQGINPSLNAIISLPMCNIIKEGLWVIKMRRDLCCIHNDLFPFADCLFMIDKLLSDFNWLNKVQLSWLQYYLYIFLVQYLMNSIGVYVLNLALAYGFSLYASINIAYEYFFQPKDLSRPDLFGFKLQSLNVNLHFPCGISLF